MGLQNETVILNYSNQNLFQNENCMAGKKTNKQKKNNNNQKS